MFTDVDNQSATMPISPVRSRSRRVSSFTAFGIAILTLVTGCRSSSQETVRPAPVPNSVIRQTQSEPVTILEGDVVSVTFPTAGQLNSNQQVRRDGKIALPLIGEVAAAGLQPTELERQLTELYSSQLTEGAQVIVSIQSSSFPVFVTGAVVRPGKIQSDRPISALEAVMEAGGFVYARANLKEVTVIRQEGGRAQHYKLDLEQVLNGDSTESFRLKPADIVYVPEKFVWF